MHRYFVKGLALNKSFPQPWPPFHPPQILHYFPIPSQFIKLPTTTDATISIITIWLIMKLFPAICLLSIFPQSTKEWRQEEAIRSPDSPMPSKGWLGGGDCYTMSLLNIYIINNLHMREKQLRADFIIFPKPTQPDAFEGLVRGRGLLNHAISGHVLHK